MAKKRAFVRYSKNGKLVPGSLIVTQGTHPDKPSTWKEVPYDICCDGGGETTRLTSIMFVPSSNGNIFSIQYIGNNNAFIANAYNGTTTEEWLEYFNTHFGWMGTFSINPESSSQVFFDIKTEIFNQLGNPAEFQFFYVGPI
jgi:hypothetical protein